MARAALASSLLERNQVMVVINNYTHTMTGVSVELFLELFLELLLMLAVLVSHDVQNGIRVHSTRPVTQLQVRLTQGLTPSGQLPRGMLCLQHRPQW